MEDQKKSTEIEDDDKSSWVFIVIGSILSVVVVVVWWLLSQRLVHLWTAPGTSPSDQVIGNAFSAVSALFSALAFAWVIVAIWMQREELELQRKEIKETRIVHTDSGVSLEKQAKTLLLAAYLNIVESTREAYSTETPERRGDDSLWGRRSRHIRWMLETLSEDFEDAAKAAADSLVPRLPASNLPSMKKYKFLTEFTKLLQSLEEAFRGVEPSQSLGIERFRRICDHTAGKMNNLLGSLQDGQLSLQCTSFIRTEVTRLALLANDSVYPEGAVVREVANRIDELHKCLKQADMED